MKTSILYAVVVKFQDGGEVMDSYLKVESALNKSKEIIEHIVKSKREGIKVYLSELEYDEYKNRLLTSDLINNESELLFNN